MKDYYKIASTLLVQTHEKFEDVIRNSVTTEEKVVLEKFGAYRQLLRGQCLYIRNHSNTKQYCWNNLHGIKINYCPTAAPLVTPDDHPVWKSLAALEAAQVQPNKWLNEKMQKYKLLLDSKSTVEDLLEVWPEVEKFIPKPVKKVSTLSKTKKTLTQKDLLEIKSDMKEFLNS